MTDYWRGIRVTECLRLKKSNCKNCYKCIRNCPVKSIRFSDNQANIVPEECILCGHCFVACPQGAKEIRNEADKQVQILLANADATAATVRAEGDAEYMRILSEVYDSPEEAEFYTFMIALDALQASMTGAEKTLILDADSPIAKLFY